MRQKEKKLLPLKMEKANPYYKLWFRLLKLGFIESERNN